MTLGRRVALPAFYPQRLGRGLEDEMRDPLYEGPDAVHSRYRTDDRAGPAAHADIGAPFFAELGLRAGLPRLGCVSP